MHVRKPLKNTLINNNYPEKYNKPGLDIPLGETDRTIRTAISDLVVERSISVVKMNGLGTVPVYVVNSHVAWAEKRENLRYAAFSATVVADADAQESSMLGASDLRQIPSLYPGERQFPVESGDPHLSLLLAVLNQNCQI